MNPLILFTVSSTHRRFSGFQYKTNEFCKPDRITLLSIIKIETKIGCSGRKKKGKRKIFIYFSLIKAV